MCTVWGFWITNDTEDGETGINLSGDEKGMKGWMDGWTEMGGVKVEHEIMGQK